MIALACILGSMLILLAVVIFVIYKFRITIIIITAIKGIVAMLTSNKGNKKDTKNQ